MFLLLTEGKKTIRCIHLRNGLLTDMMLQPVNKTGNRKTITNMRLSCIQNLGLILDRLKEIGWIVCRNDRSLCRKLGTESCIYNLYICKNLLDMLGGRIRCRSRLGDGTEFTVTLQYELATEEQILLSQQKTATYEDRILYGKNVLLEPLLRNSAK